MSVMPTNNSPPRPSRTGGRIRVCGARVNNLADLSVEIPHNQLVVITGPSGSGKSSLAFDTLYAEGQRQYIESLSVYARQFLHQLQRPDVDLVEGLPPTICIDQRPGQQGRRSTVATTTEIYDYLRLLMARVGIVSCFQCGQEVQQQSPEQIQAQVMALPEGTKTMIMAPIVRGRKGTHKDVFAKIRKAGLVRARVDGHVYDLDHLPELSTRKNHQIDAVVDRVVMRPGLESRVGESVRLAIEQASGLVLVCYLTPEAEARSKDDSSWCDRLFSTVHACPNCNISYEEVQPRTFSFNSPYGACPVCDGMGTLEQFDPALVIPQPELSITQGAIAPWRGLSERALAEDLTLVETFLQRRHTGVDVPVESFSLETREELFVGDDKAFPGVLMLLEKEIATSSSKRRVEQLREFRATLRCDACLGSRLRAEAMHVRIDGKAIHEITDLPISDSLHFFSHLNLDEPSLPIAEPIIREIHKRLEFLQRVGVGYVSLSRPTDTLSGGELQRVRLASSIGSGLAGVCYILDEPSIGLHARDNDRLISALRELQRQGSSVLVVEHDDAMMREADQVIDIGPEAGARGGRLVAQGTLKEICAHPHSLTGDYLSGRKQIPWPAHRRKVSKSHAIVLEGAVANNLKNVSVRLPLGVLICVTGVSGSGKSSLVNETLGPALMHRLGSTTARPAPYASLRGVSKLDKVVQIDQSPIGRSPRSNPATYSGIYDEVRKVFAGTREAKQWGFAANRFSFNVKGGRCEVCQGQGQQKVEMSFLPDMYVTCEECQGKRFDRQTLRVKYRGLSIADILELEVDAAAEFFQNFTHIARVLEGLKLVGLGYLPLGQPSTTLSGGEAQRIKLATELARVETGKTLYLLDEPTTGLHFDDIRRLLQVLHGLVDKGNTVVVIEHNLDVIQCADWVIDMGPDGGSAGGEVIVAGTPEEVAASPSSTTGRFLRKNTELRESMISDVAAAHSSD